MQRITRLIVVVTFAVTTNIATAPAAAPVVVGDDLCFAVGSHNLDRAITVQSRTAPCVLVSVRAQVCRDKCGWTSTKYSRTTARAGWRFTNQGIHCGWSHAQDVRYPCGRS